MTVNDHPSYFRRRFISGLYRERVSFSTVLHVLPFRERERKRDERVLGGLSIIDKAFGAPLSCEDDSDQEMLLIRLVSANLSPKQDDWRWDLWSPMTLRDRQRRGEYFKDRVETQFSTWAREVTWSLIESLDCALWSNHEFSYILICE